MAIYTYNDLFTILSRNGCNLADVALGRMMVIVEEQTGVFPSWSDFAPDWIVRNCLGC